MTTSAAVHYGGRMRWRKVRSGRVLVTMLVVAAAGWSACTEGEATREAPSGAEATATEAPASVVDGVEGSVDEVIASGVETAVTVSFSGREDEGRTIETGQAALVLDDGSRLRQRRGVVDGRKMTMYFEPLPEGREIDSVTVSDVSLSDSPEAALDRSSLVPVGLFLLNVDPAVVVEIRSTEWAVDVRAPFGAGEIVIERAGYSGDKVILYGRLPGARSPEPFVGGFDGVVVGLTLPDGSTATFEGIRLGYDAEDASAFAMQFSDANVTAGMATLQMDGAQPWDGAPVSATLEFEIP